VASFAAFYSSSDSGFYAFSTGASFSELSGKAPSSSLIARYNLS